MDYHEWGAMLKHYEIHVPKLTNIMQSSMTVLTTIRNDCLTSLLIRQYCFATDSDRGLLQLMDSDILNSLFKY